MTGRRRIVISTCVLAIASAVIWTILAASSPMSSAMPGMDHGAGAAAPSTPPTTMSGDMPGMDHGSGDTPQSTPTTTMSGDMPGMDHGSADPVKAAADRPLAPVLGVFGGGASAVMLTAGFLRHRDRARLEAKKALRAARRAGRK